MRAISVSVSGRAAGSPVRKGWREHGTNRDVLTAERPVVGFQGPGLIGKSLPVEGGCPREGEDIAGEDAGGIHGLAELPIGEMGGAAEGIEIRWVRFGDRWPRALSMLPPSGRSNRGRRA